jgi:hypothetical protein
MKKIFKYLPFIAFLLLGMAEYGQAQDIAQADKRQEKTVNIQHLLESKRFVFDARSVSPIGGPTRQLTSSYDLTVKGDSMVSFLPYFGRAYVAPMTSADAGLRFTSIDFSYQATPRRKGGWNIKIKPQDVNNVQQLNLTVSENGQASLQVTSNNRQPISFLGEIREARK